MAKVVGIYEGDELAFCSYNPLVSRGAYSLIFLFEQVNAGVSGHQASDNISGIVR
jgi:hypothetical protein